VWSTAFDQKTLIANLLDLAVKKQLAILQDASGAFILGQLKSIPQSPSPALSSHHEAAPEILSDEKLVVDKLFAAGDTIRLEPANHLAVGGALEALRQALRFRLEKIYFLTNSRYLIPGLLISFATVARCGFSIQGAPRLLTAGLAAWLLLWSLGCVALAALVIYAWRVAFSNPHLAPAARKQALVITGIFLPFLIGEAAGLALMAWATSSGVAVILAFLVAINYIFHILLRAPTRAGRALMDQIEGFRMFLAEAEKDHHAMRALAGLAPKILEKLLPYAVALNVEKVWSEKFAVTLSHGPQAGLTAYSPEWYSGPAWDPVTASTFANRLERAFSSAISSSTRVAK
jgi:hypothetical protein